MAHVYAARALVPGMLARKSGYLLNTASAAGLLASMGSAPYGVTKHAGVALAEHLAIQYGDSGIAVSVLCPQAVDTNMLRMAGAGAASVDGVLNTDAVAQTVIEAMDAETLPDPAAPRGEGVHGAQARPRPLAARHAPAARQDRRGAGRARTSCDRGELEVEDIDFVRQACRGVPKIDEGSRLMKRQTLRLKR